MARRGHGSAAFFVSRRFPAAAAVDEVIVHIADRLQMRVADRRPEKAEAALFHIFADRVREGRRGGDFAEGFPVVHNRLPVRQEAFQIGAEAAEFALHIEKTSRIGDRRPDLRAVADDAGILKQPFDIGFGERRDLLRIESGEGPPIVFAAAQDREPAQARLRRLECQELEHRPVIGDFASPLLVVIPFVKRVADTPAAPFPVLFPVHDSSSVLRFRKKNSPKNAENQSRCEIFRIFRCAAGIPNPERI